MPEIEAYQVEIDRLWPKSAAAKDIDWQSALGKLGSGRTEWPLQRIGCFGFGELHMALILTLMMAEEDSALAVLVEPDGSHPTMGGLIALWRGQSGVDRPGSVKEALADLVDAYVAEPVETAAMRNNQRYRIAPAVAEILAGMKPHLAGLSYVDHAQLAVGSPWLPNSADSAQPAAVAAMMRAEEGRPIVIRGPGNNGRKAFVRDAARLAGLNIIEVSPVFADDPAHWQQALTLSILGNAVLLCEVIPGPGETARLSYPAIGAGRLVVITGMAGAVHIGSALPPLTVQICLPDASHRRAHWNASGAGDLADALVPMILPSGNIRRAAKGAVGVARLSGDDEVSEQHVRTALRDLRDARLDALATRIDDNQEPDAIFLDIETSDEFDALVMRCRQREQLASGSGNIGVRALLSGPSGTGKTLAARHVARKLGKDLFRVDLSATVNKYIGETEKALERALSAAEELDIILLLDEGDALMAKRTDVGNSNDRYANLETNFLLQRIESFSGIILVTSNDAGRIDAAFSRRMDAVIEFSAPDELRRQDILQRQLGSETAISDGLLRDVACRCALTGGQLRNVALHARLLALDAGTPITDTQLRRAVEREYRKTNSQCPLRRTLAAVG